MLNAADKLSGFVGQSMSGQKTVKRAVLFNAIGTSGFLPAVFFNCIADVYLIGPGGTFQNGVCGGGGGEAVYQRAAYGPNMSGSYVAPASGSSTASSVTINGVLIAKANPGGSPQGGSGGVGTLSRPGGAGGAFQGGSGPPGSPGVNGGQGGSGLAANGGGSGGFGDLVSAGDLAGGKGADTSIPGIGGGGSSNNYNGGPGCVYIIFREL